MLDANKTFLLPKISERVPAGRLIKIPGIVEAAATKPSRCSGVWRLSAKGFRTGFFDIVELRIAKIPTMQKIKKALSCRPLKIEFIFVNGQKWKELRLT